MQIRRAPIARIIFKQQETFCGPVDRHIETESEPDRL